MLGAILVILTLIAAAWYVAKVGTGFTLLFIAPWSSWPTSACRCSPSPWRSRCCSPPTPSAAAGAPPSGIWKGFLWLMLAALWLLNVRPLRKALITRPFLKAYMRLLPSMSQTEKEALEAGTVWWDGELFTGKPKFEKLLASKAPRAHRRGAGLPRRPVRRAVPHVRRLGHHAQARRHAARRCGTTSSRKGFFAMIIPKKYGGLEFSAYAHSCVLVKLASRAAPAGRDHRRAELARPRRAAEPLRHRGAEEPLPAAPRARRGSAVLRAHRPARRLGRGVAARHRHRLQGHVAGHARSSGCKLNFSKRYITLAPIATVVGLAFRMFDPDKLLGEKADLGITCALIPRNTPGITIGRRHFPLNMPFQNGPLAGKDVFVPLDFIIGGPKMAGQGWRMLVEQLSVGRCISLPSNATGGAKAGVFASGAYARIRRQFNMPVGKFEGVEAVHRAHGRATPTRWMRRAPSPPAPSTAARSPRCPRRC